jgi:hypothetical protein
MRYSPRSVLLAIAYLTTSTHALPRPATYSVVNVDGGQTQYAPPTTIIQTVTESTDSETTITVPTTPTTTVVVDNPTTIVSTNYQTVPGRATETALVPEVSVWPPQSENSPPTTTTTLEQPTHYMPIPESTPTSTPEAEVVTVVSVTTATPSTTTTSYYDNGMWHTSYAIKPTSSTPPAQYSTSSTSVYTSWGVTGTGGVAMSTGSYSTSGWNSTTRYW